MKTRLAAPALSIVIPLVPRAAEIVHVHEGARMPCEKAIPWSYAAATAGTARDRGFPYQSVSTDRGLTWSAPRNTGMWGYPAHILTLPGGRLLATYGVRRVPMGIRATVSRDGGQTRATNETAVLRADRRGDGSDLGYPIAVPVGDGVLLRVCYLNDTDNVTHIAATRWRQGP
ncbi:MAG: hypothetical protein FJ221_03060 [Lentisphaerae bacterium]|nr:hypothetical protein [Lentisphaerota bacterium]